MSLSNNVLNLQQEPRLLLGIVVINGDTLIVSFNSLEKD